MQRDRTYQTTNGISRSDLHKEEDGIDHQQGDDPGLTIELHDESFDLGRATYSKNERWASERVRIAKGINDVCERLSRVEL